MKTAIRYRNSDDFARMTQMMNRAFERTFTPYNYAHNGGHSNVPLAPSTEEASTDEASTDEAGEKTVTAYLPVDIQEIDEAFTLSAYLPGVQAEDVEITFEGDDLVIRGAYPATDEEAKLIKQELFHGDFERKLTFNVAINVDEISAEVEHGVLTLTIPKAEEVRPKQIKVQAK